MCSTGRLRLQVAVFIAAVCGIVWIGVRQDMPESPKPNQMKRLSGTIAEELVYRIPKEPFPRASCKACRVGKMKAGVFSLGAFNVVEFDDLAVNIPPGGLRELKGGDAGGGVEKSAGLTPLVSMSGWKGGMKFHGITVNGLRVGRMDGTNLVPLFVASKVKNSGRKIVMKSVTLYRNGESETIPSATLALDPSPVVQWSGGSFALAE